MRLLAPATRLARLLPPETAHDLTIAALERLPVHKPRPDDPRLKTRFLRLHLSNPIGLAAGFDKDARVPRQMLGLGFGSVEVGTVTPRPQPGNPRPRVFRLPRSRAVINRYGFNSEGHAAVLARLERLPAGLPAGVNIGANKDSDERGVDYVAGVRTFAPLSVWLTVNISSPNTPGLRDLQGEKALADLLARVAAAREETQHRPPLLLKVAPDMRHDDLRRIADAVLSHGIEGMIVSNTTLSRQGVEDERHANEAGGLSGAPLFERSTRSVAQLRRHVGSGMTIVGAGGVSSGADVFAKIAAGADMVQLYTALVYEGAGLISRVKAELIERMEAAGFASISQTRGSEIDRWI